MDIDELAGRVGEERFRRACDQARRRAPGTGRSRPPPDGEDTEDTELPHELADRVEGDLPLALALYRAMPCYANLMYLEHWAARADLLAELAVLLDEPDDALADPVSYFLWCGPFEDEESRSTDAWRRLGAGASERRLRRLLDVSGPVPWAAKVPVLRALVPDARWHPSIWSAVRHAVGDVFGRVDAAGAARILDQLGDPPAGLDEAELRARLRSLG